MPSEKQISYALSLLDKNGYGSRFMNAKFKALGATMRQRSGTVRSWLESMESHEVSTLIDKLKNSNG